MKYNLAIIGGGPAGYTAASLAAASGLHVILFEKYELGGVCLNEGCIPTKTLLYSAKLYDTLKECKKFGVQVDNTSFDLKRIISRKKKIIRKLTLGIKAKLTHENITIVNGEAALNSANTLLCQGEEYSFDKLLLCTGSETLIPPIKGLDELQFWTHKEALETKSIPKSLAIIGGGVIGIEFASFFSSLGTEVTVIEMQEDILKGFDTDVIQALKETYSKKGVKFLCNTKVVEVCQEQEQIYTLQLKSILEGDKTLHTEQVLVSVGRKPSLKGLQVEKLNIETNQAGGVQTNQFMQTSHSSIYACGDITGYSLLAHTAIREAEVAIHHILEKPDKISYNAVPAVVYTNPELASVGITEEKAIQKKLPYTVIKKPMTYAGRFVAENEGDTGLCKLIINTNKEIIGVHLFGNPASEIISLASIAVKEQYTIEEWKRVIFPHPTVSEIFKEIL